MLRSKKHNLLKYKMYHYYFSTQLHVFEITRNIPRFVMYALDMENAVQPDGKAVFYINERPPRVIY